MKVLYRYIELHFSIMLFISMNENKKIKKMEKSFLLVLWIGIDSVHVLLIRETKQNEKRNEKQQNNGVEKHMT